MFRQEGILITEREKERHREIEAETDREIVCGRRRDRRIDGNRQGDSERERERA